MFLNNVASMDFRNLCVLRESFCASKLSFLKSDVPLMALTATATTSVREDIIKSLKMSTETKIVLTSFFRPNLRFSVSSMTFARLLLLVSSGSCPISQRCPPLVCCFFR